MSENNTEYHVDHNDVLAELQAEGFSMEGSTPEVPSQKEPTHETVEEPTQTPEAPEIPAEVIDRKPKEPTLVPAWKAKIAQEKLEKENEELRRQIETLQKSPTQANEQATQASIDNIRDLAEQAGLVLDDSQEMFFKQIAAAIAEKAAPKEMIQTLQAYQQQQHINYLESQFDQEFSKEVLPTIKAQYGDIPEQEMATIRTKLHDLAFTEQYSKVPLAKIFKAEVDDIGIRPSKQTVHTPKSGKTRGTEIDFSQMDESSFSQMSDEQIDAYIAAHGSNPWQNVRR